MSRLAALILAALLGACSNTGAPPESVPATGKSEKQPNSKSATPTRKPTAVLKRGGGFYKDDGPSEEIPDGLDDIPDAEPKWEPLHKPALKPYVVLGKEYVPNTSIRPYKARGIASWYGKKFHGQKTSIGEPYDMFAMTAAHTTLALPSYVRVTNLQTGNSVVVRVTDRGPFHADRIIDLSYTAAYKLGLINGGSGQVEVEAIIPGEPANTTYAQVATPPPATAVSREERAEAERLARRLVQEEKPTQTAEMAGMSADTEPAKGVYLQLGAFANGENAESLKTHLQRELEWLNGTMRVVTGGGMHRVHLGPYPNRAEAERIADKIRGALGFRPTFVTR